MINPVECYEFRLGTLITLRYTSDELAYVGEGKAYNPLAGLARSSFGVKSTNETSEFSVTLPITSKVAQEVAMFKTPSKTKLIFRRYDRTVPTAPVFYFEAVLAGASVTGETCTLKFPDSFQNACEGLLPKNVVQPGCNWTLGDSNCKVFLPFLVVGLDSSKVSNLGQGSDGLYRYAIGSKAMTNPVGWYRKGIFSCILPSGTETRTIVTYDVFNPATPNVKGIVGVSEPFAQAQANATYSLSPGCTKLFNISSNPDYQPHCTAYGATARFGGFPWVPTEKANPFILPVRL